MTAPENDAAVAGFLAGDCRMEEAEEKTEEEADVGAPRLARTKTDAGGTGVALDGPAGASTSVALTSQFVAAAGKAKAEVLGAPRLSYRGTEVSFGRAEASDLFALLSMSPEGVSTEGIIDTLWAGNGDRGSRLLESAVRQLNQVMRQASGVGTGVKFVVKVRQRRQLAAAYFDVDLWRFEAAFVRTGTAEGRAARLAALQEMLALYRGPLLDGRDDLWVLPLRQAAQRQAVDAAERFAELARTEDPDRAVDVLRLAVERVDPHSEVLWCMLMSIQGELGRLPAVRRSFELLKERMAEIDAVPSAQARQVYERLIG
ncbi:BTAD domain-containing putative transcriptional regulator [Nonomuraea wenchangensis]|uniref:AfsR/SARP family transcriptional regulator n=1 Tax=Nonomuraea wenchangensis TaxID=568860 RepID=UPI00385168F5